MYYLKFINTFIILSVKLCENVNRLLTSILELIKQIICNAWHNIAVKHIYLSVIFHLKWIFDVKKTYFSTGFLVRNFCQLSHFMTQRTIIRMAAPER